MPLARIEFDVRITKRTELVDIAMNRATRDSWEFRSGCGGGVPHSSDFCQSVIAYCPEEDRRECLRYILSTLKRMKEQRTLVSCTPPRGFLMGWKGRKMSYAEVTASKKIA